MPIRIVGGVLWLASAISVSSRHWLGGVVQLQRDRALIRRLLESVRGCRALQSMLLCTRGLSSYPKQALSVLREPLFAQGSEDVPASFCRRVSWSPKPSSDTLIDE